MRCQAIELLGELELELWSWEVLRLALSGSKRSIWRRALVHLLRLAGHTAAWREGLEIVVRTPTW